jgi:hypothetical protein
MPTLGVKSTALHSQDGDVLEVTITAKLTPIALDGADGINSECQAHADFDVPATLRFVIVEVDILGF